MTRNKLGLSLIIGGICLWLAFRDIDWSEVWDNFKDLRLAPLFWIMVMFLATHWFRARRWGVLMRHIRKVSFFELFAINAVGFLSINIFPLRLGELTRPLLLKRRQQVPISTGLAFVAVERVFDGLVASAALFIGMMTIPLGQERMSFIPVGIHALAFTALAIFVPTLIFLLLAVVKRDQALIMVDFILKLLPERFRKRLREIAENFFEGLRSLPNIWSFLWILAESIGVWGVMVVSYWLGFRSFNLDLPWGAPFCVLGLAAIGVMIPGPPGFVGTYQLFVQGALSLYGVSRSTGLAYSLVLYFLNIVYIVGSGLLFIPALATPVRDLYKEASSEQASTAP